PERPLGHAGGVAVQVTNGGIGLGKGDSEPWHQISLCAAVAADRLGEPGPTAPAWGVASVCTGVRNAQVTTSRETVRQGRPGRPIPRCPDPSMIKSLTSKD